MSAAASAPPLSYCPKVCIFDIDNTVTVGDRHDATKCPVVMGPKPAWPAKNSGAPQAALDAVATCHANGYKIAFASAESKTEGNNDKQKAFIKALDPTGGRLFDDAFFESPAYQNSWTLLSHKAPGDAALEYGRKEAMFLNILKHYEVPPQCFPFSIVFDDQTENLCSAHNLGLRTVQSSPECGGLYCEQGCGLGPSALEAIRSLPG